MHRMSKVENRKSFKWISHRKQPNYTYLQLRGLLPTVLPDPLTDKAHLSPFWTITVEGTMACDQAPTVALQNSLVLRYSQILLPLVPDWDSHSTRNSPTCGPMWGHPSSASQSTSETIRAQPQNEWLRELVKRTRREDDFEGKGR
jgi:hypothetical protein